MPFLLWGGLLGGLTAGVVAALNFLAFQWAGLPRISFSIFDWLTRILPGSLITFMIDSMVSIITRFNLGPTSTVAKQVEQGMAVAIFLLIGVVFGMALTAVGRRQPDQLPGFGRVGGLLLAVPFVLIQTSLLSPAAGPVLSVLWLLLVTVAWGWVLAKLIQYLVMPGARAPAPAVPPADSANAATPAANRKRRQFLTLVGLGSATILVTAAGVSLLEEDEDIPVTGEGGGLPEVNDAITDGPAQSPPQSELNARLEPAPGTRPELTSNADFYRIDINTISPNVNGDGWRLAVEGLVDNPLSLTLDEIRTRPAVSQAITLECISNRLAGDLISTSLWTGVRLKDILEEAGLQAGAQEVYIESVDGFFESVPMSDAMDERTLLVYEMNGQPLPREHGFPLRIYIPNRFGMKQPKWITRMEVIDHEGAGYWVERGWSETAIPPTTSVIDSVALESGSAQNRVIPVGGIAYAGARGISRVEVQVDGGPWQAAELREPPLSPLTWVQWRYDWPAQPGRHTFSVRAYDGGGELQPVTESDPHPAGATGIHAVSELIPDIEEEDGSP